MKSKTRFVPNAKGLSAWVLLAVLSLTVGVGTAEAQVTVSGPFDGVITGGDWPGVYGECFYLIPEPQTTGIEEPVGPDAFSTNHEQYVNNNCYGGPLFSNFPDDSRVDWRVFRAGNPANAFAFNTDAQRPGSAQFNPCLGSEYHATWDNDTFDADPLTIELTVNVTGDLEVAYYFVNGNEACRGLDYFLAVDGVEMASGYVQDIAEGKYVVFDVAGLEEDADGTVISFWAKDARGDADCAPPATGGFDTNMNTHISGVFVSGDCLPEPEDCPEDPVCDCDGSSSSSGSSGTSAVSTGSSSSGSSGSSGTSAVSMGSGSSSSGSSSSGTSAVSMGSGSSGSNGDSSSDSSAHCVCPDDSSGSSGMSGSSSSSSGTSAASTGSGSSSSSGSSGGHGYVTVGNAPSVTGTGSARSFGFAAAPTTTTEQDTAGTTSAPQRDRTRRESSSRQGR